VAADGQCHIVPGRPPRDPARQGPWPTPRGTFSMVAAPIHAAGPLWGALWVAAPEPAWRTGGEAAVLGRFSELVALAIAKAEAREWVVAEALAEAFSGERDVGDHLAMIAQSALRAMGAARITIYSAH